MVKEHAFLAHIESFVAIEEHVGHREAKLIVSSGKSSIGNITEIQQVCHHLIEVWSVGGVAEVSVLLGYKLVGFVAKLSLDHILEAEFV